MSIWSTILTLEPVAEAGYHPGDGEQGGFVDVADARPWYGDDGLRLSIGEPTERGFPDGWRGHVEAECLLNREQITALRDALTTYLDTPTPPSTH